MVPIFVMLGRFVRAVVGAWRSDESFRIPLALVVTVVLGDPGTPPAPTASELLDAALRAVVGIVLLLLVVAAALAVVFLILWLLSKIRLNGLGSVLMANRLRTAWIGLGVLFFVMVIVPGALLIYQYSGIGD